MRWSFAVVMACACGRVGFQPLVDGNVASSGGDGGGAPSDGRSSVFMDGSTGSGGSGSGSATACAAAVDVMVGATTTSTCVSGDHLKGCGPVGTQEVIFKFVAPATSGYNFAAYDHGTMNVSDSTAELDPSCAMTETCSGILGLTMNQDDVLYFIVESSTGGCDMIDFTITAS
ncbi:MAG TPA: hypothetical protein VGG28_32800 [Kofleriaceae bacterium]